MGKKKAVLCIMLSFMMTFTCIGYAAVSDELQIDGSAQFYFAPIYISNVSVYSGNGTLQSENHATETVLQSSLLLPNNKNASIVLAVTVKNRTDDVYGYNATIAGTDTSTYSNPNVTYAVYADAACKTRLAQKTPLYPKTTAEGADGLTFYVKFSYQNGYTPSSAETLNSYLNFNFKTPIDSIIEDAAVNNAIDQFYDILNDHIGDVDYNDLIFAMDNVGNSDRNISYIGNVAGAPAADVAAINSLFDGQLSVNINGTEQEVKFILKRENIDGNTATGGPTIKYTDGYGQQTVTGFEMVMYMTTETLERDSFLGSTYKTVYAVVYTSYDGGKTWEQLGEMYKGEARVVSYAGSYFGEGSFTTDTWRSTVNYYSLGTRQSIETLIAKIPKS